jgi:L-lysine 6-transaminase
LEYYSTYTPMRKISKQYLDEFSNYVVMDPYPFVIDLKKSKGMWIKTVDGDEIFDWAGYYGSRLIGHNHPRMYEPGYTEKLLYAANNKMANPDFLTPECVEYYRKIYQLAPDCIKNSKLEIYAVNSGAEAVENLMKYFLNLYDTKRLRQGKPIGTRRIIYFEQAFHGRTIFTLNITQLSHGPQITKNFEQMVFGNIQVPFPAIDTTKTEEENYKNIDRCLQEIRNQVDKYPEEIVGIIVEPIQGAGGHRITYPHFFRELSKLAHDYDFFLGFDEVQTAGGQTGNFFMADSFDLPYPPQGIASGKKLANGVIYMYHPMNDIGILDSTWGGNLADMVRFCQEMKIVEEEKLIEQVAEKASFLLNGMHELEAKHKDIIYNIRGMGLYQGFSLHKPSQLSALVDTALENENLLLLDAGVDTIRLRPVLDVTTDDISLMIHKLDRCLCTLES